jgi:hypothetical protein
MDDMTDQHEDPKFEQWLKDVARTTYHPPHATPREEMWARIQNARRHKHVIELRPWTRWAVAAAAVLILGIGIGRWTVRQQQPAGGVTPVASGSDASRDSSRDLAYRVAATQYLSRTEALLTSFRADARPDARDAARFAAQARDLLTTAQLMLDSPAGDDPRMRALLEDLELVLVQISQLGAKGEVQEADLIRQGMNQSNVLPKLRSAIPAGPVPVRTQGVL